MALDNKYNQYLFVDFNIYIKFNCFRFEMINHTEPMDDDEFDQNAMSVDLDWGEHTQATEDMQPTTDEPLHQEVNQSEPSHVQSYSDIHVTDGFGIHILGRSFGVKTAVWYMMVWIRTDKVIHQKWIMLDFDPSQDMYDYEIEVIEDLTTMEDHWIVNILADGIFVSELIGVVLPEQFTIKIRNWNYENHIYLIHDPFNPFIAENVIGEVKIPLPQVK